MMKVIFIAIYLFISVSAGAQILRRDTFYNDISKKKFVMRSATVNSNRSYVTINEKVYTGLLDSLNTDSIENFSVIKSADAVTLFGKRAKNGAIFITMKEHNNTDIIELPPPKKDITDFILNGKVSNEKQITELRERILNITILKYDKKSVSEELKRKVTLVAVTRDFAIICYQEKISSLSEKYRQYLKSHHNSDDKLVFLINNIEYPDPTDERIKKLYDLFSDNVTFQTFSLNYVTGTGETPSFVEINYKQN